MKRKIYCLPLIMLMFFQPAMANDPVRMIRDYIKVTYGERLVISDEQIEQLSWVIDNPVHTPEMDAKARQKTIHREIPRALSRLYSLQLLRSGTQDDYQQFVAPQKDGGTPKLNKDSFNQMYNEGSLAMYSTLKKGFTDGSLKQSDLDLWYAHWLANIAGFRGHLAPVGSQYLTQRTFMVMNQIKTSLDKMYRDLKVNPMQVYLQKRSNSLHLSSWTKKPEERQALASLAAMLRLFTPQDGKVLFTSFRKLPAKDQQRWIAHVERQLKILPEPAPTYAPAVFANGIEIAGVAESIQKLLPLAINTYAVGEKMRTAGELGSDVPLSFRELASETLVKRVLSSEKPMVVDINPENGLATLK